ncbi:MAG TPA: hypothetical protein VFS31_04175 [Chitinophagaceae bacterium]|nr:hypothetical protein [Chitinophagaceae bacterium]
MNFEKFRDSLTANHPPAGSSAYLRSLWHDAKGDWETAHNIIQDVNDKTAAWVHAYLHRKEGDTGNANYWYAKAGRSMPRHGLEQEWEEIVRELL